MCPITQCSTGTLTLKEILLCEYVTALNHLLQKRRKNDVLVCLEIHKLAKPDQITAYEELQLFALLSSLFAFTRVSLVLQPDPQLVHLNEVGDDEGDRVLEVTFGPKKKRVSEVRIDNRREGVDVGPVAVA